MTDILTPPPTASGDITLDLREVKISSDDHTTGADSGVIMDPASTTSDSVDRPIPPQITSGPDLVVPADDLWTCQRDTPVRLRTEAQGPLAAAPVSVISVMQRTVKRFPNNTALGQKVDGQWKKWTYQEYYRDVRQAARAFLQLGLEQYHGVGIVGFNSPEWFISDLAAIFAGGFAVGIYTTNSPEACQYVAHNADCNIIVVENDAQLQKILKVRDQLPALKAIIQYSGTPKESYPDVYSWAEMMKLGAGNEREEELESRIKAQAPNKCCTLIYTSGTTGNPKGVMLSHDNMTWTANVAGQTAKLLYGEEVAISYLPLSHIAAQMLDIYMPLFYGAACYFAQPDALKGSLPTTLKEVRPTLFFGVPRVWEKFQEGLVKMGRQNTGLKRKVAVWAKGVGLKGNMALMNGSSKPFGWSFANKAVFQKVRQGLGLDRCRFCFTGAAPITRETLEFFMSLNIPLLELYGMSESCGPHTISFPWKFNVSSVGVEFLGVTTKLANTDKDGNGEICMGGRHVFMGYLNMEDKTQETMDEDGWLHTGDIGRRDKNGYLYITGRIKELIITAGGENVAPVPIEDIVKEELSVISNCMLIGDERKFLSILLTLKSDVDPDTMSPLDTLTGHAQDWCKERGSKATTVSQILDSKDEFFLRGIQEGIDRSNARSCSRAQKIQKWSILPKDFSIPGEELGPTLKLKRPVVANIYKSTIEAFYVD